MKFNLQTHVIKDENLIWDDLESFKSHSNMISF